MLCISPPTVLNHTTSIHYAWLRIETFITYVQYAYISYMMAGICLYCIACFAISTLFIQARFDSLVIESIADQSSHGSRWERFNSDLAKPKKVSDDDEKIQMTNLGL